MSRQSPFSRTRPLALAMGLLVSITAATPTAATILTFDQVRSAGGTVTPTVSGQNLPADYGDRVAAGTMDVAGGRFTYAEAGEGYTPNISTTIFSGTASPLGPGTSLWRDGYGDLSNVLLANNASNFLAVRLTADPGFQVGLFGFDLAGWPNADYVIDGIRVTGAAGLLYALADVRVEGDLTGPRHTAFAFDGGLFAEELLLTIDFAHLGAGQHDNIGLDNLRFGQSPPPAPVPGGGSGASEVPEPGTLPLLALAAFGAWWTRRKTTRGDPRCAGDPSSMRTSTTTDDHAVSGRRLLAAGVTVAFGLMLAACGGGGDSTDDADAGATVTTVIGAAGGTATGPDGAQAVVPAAALTQDTTIGLARSGDGAPALPAELTAIGPTFAFTPHGTTFAQPVTVTVPFDAASLPAGETPALYKTTAGQQGWEEVGALVQGATMVGPVNGFSHLRVVLPLVREKPYRQWGFGLLDEGQIAYWRQLDGVPQPSQRGGVVSDLASFGPLPDFDVPVLSFTDPGVIDHEATGYVFAQGNGRTYGTYAQAPNSAPDSGLPVGGQSQLAQFQSYLKLSDDARLTVTVTHVELEVRDFTRWTDAITKLGSRALETRALWLITAYKDGDAFFTFGARLSLFGRARNWRLTGGNLPDSMLDVWDSLDDTQFEYVLNENDEYWVDLSPGARALCGQGSSARVRLRQPRTFEVDLSSVRIGEAFTLFSQATSEAINRRGGTSARDCGLTSAIAYLRDPSSMGGPKIEYSGLLPTNEPDTTLPPRDSYEPPASCPGPDPVPAAGTLQFSAPAYFTDEAPGSYGDLLVTRTGGSQGAVTVTVTTVDDTAIAGSDYESVRTTLHFGDGDSGSRLVEIPIIPNAQRQLDRRVIVGLSEPGGCAALGIVTTTVLTIEDDDGDAGPPPGTLDDTFGASGRVTLPGFGGDNAALALQPDGRILMAGGTFVDFVLARFNADGSADTGFGSLGNGTVTTDIAGGAQQEQARVIAVQPDGRIVVAGEARPAGGGQDLRVALTRYLADGSLDASFGTDGKVFATSAVGRIFAIALDPDGRIVVSGDVARPGTANDDYGDVMIARYLPNGVLDPSFGTGGRTEIDITGTTDLGRNLLRLPDGSYVVSGDPVGAFAEPTAVARFTPTGQLDTGFGQQGKVALPGVLVGRGLALQGDGKLLLAGSVGAGIAARFAVMRLNADGSTDTGFGNSGLVSLNIGGDTEVAKSVAVQPDGRIVVAGGSGGGAVRNFAVARLLADGSPDPSFAGTGTLAVDIFGARDEAERVLIQPDGRILLGGWARDPANVLGYALVRLNP